MGGSLSREGIDLSDEDDDREVEFDHPASGDPAVKTTLEKMMTTPASLAVLDGKLRSLHSKYSSETMSPCYSPSSPPPTRSDPNVTIDVAKLYLHIGGSSKSARWILSDKIISFAFRRSAEYGSTAGPWFLDVGSKLRAEVGPSMQLKPFPQQQRVDFVAGGVWALKFLTSGGYRRFYDQYQNCLFENAYGLEATEENRVKVFGKDFMAWAMTDVADESVWEDREENFDQRQTASAPARFRQQLLEDFEEAATEGGIQSLALGALDNSFLVSDSGIQVVKNFSHGIHGKGAFVRFSGNVGERGGLSTSKKALLMKAETNMLLLSPAAAGRPHATGVHQLDIETGKLVTEWKFEKDGAGIAMRDIANDSKGSQLDPSVSTFLGLDDNRLCRWDMRDRRGSVQAVANSSSELPVLQWTQGHQFSTGTNFQCFASTGDGSIVVGSLDGKIRLYSKNSMRMAKTAFPGLGSPITHVDVTYDGKWILGTTDTYLILICTVFKDNDGKEKNGFSGRMGKKIAAPRLLKLTPLDSHLAGTNNKLHGGRFSWVTENGKQERHLVGTVGKFSVIWNFQQVKNSNHECYQNQEGLKGCYCYKIVLKDESIVESRFMHDKFAINDSPEAPLVVATTKKVSSFSMLSRS